MKNSERPEPGTPEFDKWLNERAEKRAKEIFEKETPEEFADVGRGIIAGPKKSSDIMPEKTIAEDIAIDKYEKRSHLKIVK